MQFNGLNIKIKIQQENHFLHCTTSVTASIYNDIIKLFQCLTDVPLISSNFLIILKIIKTVVWILNSGLTKHENRIQVTLKTVNVNWKLIKKKKKCFSVKIYHSD